MKRYKNKFEENANSKYIQNIANEVNQILKDPFNNMMLSVQLIARGINEGLDISDLILSVDDSIVFEKKRFKKLLIDEINRIL